MTPNRPRASAFILKAYLRSLLKPTPIWTKLYVTRHCNFHCQYCAAVDQKRKDPTFKELTAMILKIKNLGCNCIGFMGGEPTLRKDLVDLVGFCTQNKFYTQLATNGSFLIHHAYQKNGKTLIENLAQSGLGTINLSVDSVVRDYQTSGKELPKANQVFKSLLKIRKKSGLVFILNCVISKQNLSQVPDLLEFCHQNKVMMAAIFAQNPKPLANKFKSQAQNILLSSPDAAQVSRTATFLIKRKKQGYQILEPIAYFEAIKKWVKNQSAWNCDAGLYTLEVDTDGRIGLCGYLPFLNLNIHDFTQSHYQQIKKYRQQYLPHCSFSCLPACEFNTAYYRRHPLQLIIAKLRYSHSF